MPADVSVSIAEEAGLSIGELGRGYRSGRRNPVAVARALLDRIRREEREVRAFITLCEARAMDEAEASRRRFAAGAPLGPLDGIPCAAKDSLATAGVRTTANSRLLADWTPDTDCAAVAAMHRAGAVLVGKTTMNEFGFGGFELAPWARNPLLPSRGAGGSSTGSAAAVAAGFVPFALGTDGGGSVRVPAAVCGIVGFAPTPGFIDGSGPLGPAALPPTNRVGALAGSVGDARLVASVLASRSLDACGTRRWRVGRLRGEEARVGLEPVVSELFERTIARAAGALGVRVLDLVVEGFAEARRVNWEFLSLGAYRNFGEMVAAGNGLCSGDFIEVIRRGRDLDERGMGAAEDFRAGFKARLNRAFENVDAIVTPTLFRTQQISEGLDFPAPPGVFNPEGAFTAPFNLADAPAISIPCGRTPCGAPAGLQIAGAPGNDSLALELAALLERIA